MPTSSLLLLLLTNKILDLGAKADTKSPKNQMKNGVHHRKGLLYVTSGSLGCRISGNGPDIYVLKKRSHDRSYQIPKSHMYKYHVDRLRVLSGKYGSANVIYYTWTTATSQIHRQRPYIHHLSPGSGLRKKSPGFFPSTGGYSSKTKPPTRLGSHL